jgi:hypothetical protein
MDFARKHGRFSGAPVPHAPTSGDPSGVLRTIFGMAGILGMLLVYLVFMGRPKAPVEPGAAPVASSMAVSPWASDTAEVGSARPFMGLLDSAKDFTEVEEDDAYRALVLNVKRLTIAEIDSRATAYKMSDLIANPALYRGAFVRFTGLVVTDTEMRRLDKNPAGIDFAYRVYVADSTGDEGVCVDLLDSPGKLDPRGQVVEVIGVFLKVRTYETKFRNKSGETSKSIPFLIGKQIRVVTEKVAPSGWTELLILTVVFSALPLLGILVTSFAKRRHQEMIVDVVNKARSRRPPLPGGKRGFPGANVTVLGPAAGEGPPPGAPAEPKPALPAEGTAPSSPEPPAPPPADPPPAPPG